jgi:hypothetical protein
MFIVAVGIDMMRGGFFQSKKILSLYLEHFSY